MSVQEQIEQRLAARFQLDHLEVLNESKNHNVPPDSETHFKVSLVSAEFEGMKLLERHRSVNETLKEALAGPVHALAIHTYTEAEWQKRHGTSPMSPPCLGGESRSG